MPLALSDSTDRTVRLPEFGESSIRPDVRPATAAIGPYTRPELIGAGGMGVVYKATAPDGRALAVKVIPAGATDRAVAARLEREWQTLATLDHPNVAQVIDSGTTADGRPYFAMEYIPGDPLVRYADDRKLTLVERLELFLGVAAAVTHLHRRGIIHRDLKPGNILVTEVDSRPVPKLIDFGLAKEIGAASGATSAGGYVGTPNYMAPEQATGTRTPVDTRADVYALGVILFELVVGSLPLAAPGDPDTGVLELLIRLQVADPPTPSSRLAGEPLVGLAERRKTDPARLRAAVAGDLDRVILKALERDRERRYGTVDALAADVRRYLDHEPVSVGAPGPVTEFYRFVRRNKAVAASLLIGLIGLVGVVIGTTYGLIRARAAEQLATERLSEVERTRAELEVALGETAAAKELAESGRRTAEAQVARLKDEAVGLGDQRDMLRMDKLRPVPEVNAALAKLAAAAEHPDLQGQVRFGLRKFAADNLWKLGDKAAALRLMEKVYEERRAEIRDDGDPRVRELGLGLADLYAIADKHDKAVPLFEKLLRPLGPVDSPERLPVLIAHLNLAIGYDRLGKPAKSAAKYREVLERGVPIYGIQHPTMASAALALSIFLVDKSPAEALQLADSIYSVVGHRQLSLYSNPAHALYALGWVYDRAKQPDRAADCYRRSADRWLLEKPTGWESHDIRGQLAEVLAKQGKHEEAAREAVAAYLALERVPAEFDGAWQQKLYEARRRVIQTHASGGDLDDALDWATRPFPAFIEVAPQPRLANRAAGS